MAGVATWVKGFHVPEVVARMPYRGFGATGRVVSALSWGATSLGGFYDGSGGGRVDEDEVTAVVREAVRRGVNLIDTAPWYGHGEVATNVLLGKALAEVPRGAYYLHTKVGRYSPDVCRQFDFSYGRTLESIDESLAALGVSYLDCVSVHDPEFAPSLDVVLTETLPAIAAAAAAGKVRAVGITGYPLSVLRELAARTRVPIACAISYSHYTLHDTSLETSGTLAALQAAGVGVINASPLSMGLLTVAGPPAWHPATPALKSAAAAAAAYCASEGMDYSRLALAHALANPRIPTTMGSTKHMVELRNNLDLVTGADPLTAHERAVLATLLTRYFAPETLGAAASWEGIEVEKYWRKVREARAATSAAAAAGVLDVAASVSRRPPPTASRPADQHQRQQEQLM